MALTDAPQEPTKGPESWLRKLLPFTTVGVIAAALYVAWTFYSRHQANVEAEKAAAAKVQEQRQRTVNAVFGSGEIVFSIFSADSGLLEARAAHTTLLRSREREKYQAGPAYRRAETHLSELSGNHARQDDDVYHYG